MCRDQPVPKLLRRCLLEIEKYLKFRGMLEYVFEWRYWISHNIMDVSNICLEITLICLALNKILNKCISGLGIQRQGMLKRF